MLMSAADYRERCAAAARASSSTAARGKRGRRAAAGARHRRRRRHLRFRAAARARRADDGAAGHERQDRQPHAAHRRDVARTCSTSSRRCGCVCREIGLRPALSHPRRAQRHLPGDASAPMPAHGTDYHQRFLAYLHEVQDEDLTLGVAMTDAKGDRSKRPGAQANPRRLRAHQGAAARTASSSAAPRRSSPARPTCTSSWSCRAARMTPEDADFAVCCAVPVDAEGVTIVARPAGRPGEAAAKFSAKYGQSTGVVQFDDVFVPWDRVFLAGETRKPASSPPPTPRTIAIPASARAPASATC